MPNTLRQTIRRELESCRKHTSAINYYLEKHEEIAQSQHPEIAQQINVIRQTNALLDNLIEQLREIL